MRTGKRDKKCLPEILKQGNHSYFKNIMIFCNRFAMLYGILPASLRRAKRI